MGTSSLQHDEAVAHAEKALAAGHLLHAFDIATRWLKTADGPPRLRYLQVLALARMKETERALALYERHLAGRRDDVDTLALRARLMKDAALYQGVGHAGAMFQAASLAYEDVYRRTGATFPAVNAATMAFLSGDRERASGLARLTLAMLVNSGPCLDYFAGATIAEAQLLLGDEAAAMRSMTAALALPGAGQGERSSTYRQIATIASAGGHGEALAAMLRPPPVLTYCGHRLVADAAVERSVTAEIRSVLDKLDVRIGYGALACGGDILIAEQLLARGGELNVVLPFLSDDFKRIAVASGGDDWIGRYERCLKAAGDVIIASETSAVGGDGQYRYGSMLTMGYARLRAAHLVTEAVQLAVWDGSPATGIAGVAADVGHWRSHGGRTEVIPVDSTRLAAVVPADAWPIATTRREIRAIIFMDFAKFSRIEEPDLPEFWNAVIGRAAAVIDTYGADVCSHNSWGDAVYIVTRTPGSAARLALELRAAFSGGRVAAFSAGAGMRISAHVGPVYEAIDPICGTTTFFGREVTRTARIEPITPVGEIYVTHAFAAVLEMNEPGEFGCSYVGRVRLAKAFGDETMYRLDPAPLRQQQPPPPRGGTRSGQMETAPGGGHANPPASTASRTAPAGAPLRRPGLRSRAARR